MTKPKRPPTPLPTMPPQLPAAVMVSCDNCQLVTGMSWTWVLRFAASHGVPVWRESRKHLIPADQLRVAMERAISAQPPTTVADEVAQLRASISADLRAARR